MPNIVQGFVCLPYHNPCFVNYCAAVNYVYGCYALADGAVKPGLVSLRFDIISANLTLMKQYNI